MLGLCVVNLGSQTVARRAAGVSKSIPVVPLAVKIVCHEYDVVDSLANVGDRKRFQVPVRSWSSDGDLSQRLELFQIEGMWILAVYWLGRA